MKTKKLENKLVLSKSTIANLEHKALSAVKGGYWETEIWTGCNTWHPICYTRPAWDCQTQESVCICIAPTEFDC